MSPTPIPGAGGPCARPVSTAPAAGPRPGPRVAQEGGAKGRGGHWRGNLVQGHPLPEPRPHPCVPGPARPCLRQLSQFTHVLAKKTTPNSKQTSRPPGGPRATWARDVHGSGPPGTPERGSTRWAVPSPLYRRRPAAPGRPAKLGKRAFVWRPRQTGRPRGLPGHQSPGFTRGRGAGDPRGWEPPVKRPATRTTPPDRGYTSPKPIW